METGMSLLLHSYRITYSVPVFIIVGIIFSSIFFYLFR
jgi:hypothetical protein